MNSKKNESPRLGGSVVWWVLLVVACGNVAISLGQVIPADRLYTEGWRTAGVRGGIPDTSGRPIHATITSTGDSTDRTKTINNAIASCPSGQVVVLGAGTFRVNGTLNINNKSGVVVRGTLVDGVKATIVDSRQSGAFGWVMGNTSADYQKFDGPEITVDAAQGATVLTFATAASFTVGDRVSIHQDNSTIAAWPVVGYMSGSRDRGMRHGSKIVSKTSTTITIEDPLPFAFTTAQNAEVHIVGDGFAYQCGIEDLVFDMSNGGSTFGIAMWNVDQCWLKNVEAKEADSYIVYMLKALHCTIQKSYLNAISGTGNNGAGLLIEQSSMNLIQDNIIRFCQPNIEVNFGCTGNVFAYNALLQSQGNISICANHGAHNAYNLYEGNVAPNLKPDGYFGSVSHDTALRNRFTGADDIGDSQRFAAIDLKRFTRYYNIVGNVLGLSTSATYEQTGSGNTGASIYQLGYPNIGNTVYSGTASPLSADYWSSWPGAGALPSGYQERDLDVSATLIRKGNYNTANQAVPAEESLGGDTIPNSYYLSEKPLWFASLSWPPFDPTAAATATYRTSMSLSFEAIPAGYRYLNGGAEPPGGGGGDTVAPSSPGNLAATATSATQISVTWTASTDNVGVTGYRVERSQGSGSTSFSQVATPSATSYSDTALTAGTVYNYRIRAVDAAGNLGPYSATVTATTTTTPDTTPPTTPSSLAAAAVGATQINLTWTASSDAGGVTGYLVERSTGQGSTSYAQVGTPAGTSYTDTGLSASSLYNYRVRASDAAGNLSGYSAVVTVTTLADDPGGLVAAYSFDEGAGTAVHDQSFFGNDGTVTSTSWTTAGKYGRALSFDGTSSLVTIPYAPSLNVSDALTLEAWVRPFSIDASQWRSLIYRPNTAPGDVNYVLQGVSRTSGVPSFGLVVTTENLFAGASLPVDTWSHVAVTYDGTAMRLYINGQEQGSQPQTGALPSTTQPLLLGMNWAGLIDEVRVYNRALTMAEIQADMDKPISGEAARPSPPKGLLIVQ